MVVRVSCLDSIEKSFSPHDENLHRKHCTYRKNLVSSTLFSVEDARQWNNVQFLYGNQKAVSPVVKSFILSHSDIFPLSLSYRPPVHVLHVSAAPVTPSCIELIHIIRLSSRCDFHHVLPRVVHPQPQTSLVHPLGNAKITINIPILLYA